MFSVPARFLFGGRMDFIFIFTNSKLYFKNRKMSAEPSENKVLASQKFQFYRLSVQISSPYERSIRFFSCNPLQLQ